MKQCLLEGSRLEYVTANGTELVSWQLEEFDIDIQTKQQHRNPESEARGDRPIISSTTKYYATCRHDGKIWIIGMNEMCMLNCRVIVNTPTGNYLYHFLASGHIDVEYTEPPVREPMLFPGMLPDDDLKKNFEECLQSFLDRGFVIDKICTDGDSHNVDLTARMSRPNPFKKDQKNGR
jgi:hypothetical protein